ncbi:MAG: hypothetical protein R3176_02630 [Woeseiaceae bacterium]|nr:hypothetical protein [Woeseiaceae bacterium]
MEPLILVIDRESESAENLKGLIEFMDAPLVRTAGPDDWQEAVGGDRLQALFIGPDLDDAEVERLVAAVGRIDPNVAIVMVKGEGER